MPSLKKTLSKLFPRPVTKSINFFFRKTKKFFDFNVTILTLIKNFHSKAFIELSRKTHLFALKYPKIIVFTLCVILTIFLSQNAFFVGYLKHLEGLSYLGVLIAGSLFSFGLTTPLATLALISIQPSNLFLAAIIGGLGATLSDYLIFRFVKFSFETEFRELRKEKPFLFIRTKLKKKVHPTILNYLVFVFAGFILSTPLPDEAGIMLLTGIMEIKPKRLVVISFVFKTIGVLALLAITI